MSSSRDRSRPPASTRLWSGAHTDRRGRGPLAPSERDSAGAARRACRRMTPSTGRVTLTCSTQMPHLTRTAICRRARLSGMRPAGDRARRRRRLRTEDVAGARICACWSGSRARLHSSVAWTEDRRENLIASFHSRDQHVTLEGAFDKNGKLIALSADILANVGAYSCFPTTCGVEPLMAMAEMPGPYDVRQYACLARGVVTNTCPMAPYRGVSRPVITFTLERLMDKAAARLRHRSDRHPPTQPDRQISLHLGDGPRVRRGDLQGNAGACGAAIDVPAFRKRQKEARAKGRYLGIGFATFSERTGYGSPAFAARGMEITPGLGNSRAARSTRRASSRSRIGSSPHGQGLRTTLAQIIADELGIEPAIDQGDPRRHRPHALWLGHLRQPLAGHLRRRDADCRAEQCAPS